MQCEWWIVCNQDGTEAWRGAGDVGAGQYQDLPPGGTLILVPREVIAGGALNLDALRAAQVARIDAEAEQVRMRYLTPGAGQAMTYARKEAEARAWVADDAATVPFLSAEATARGMTLGALVAEVIAMADAWAVTGAAIEALRMGAKAAIGRAQTLAAIVVAARADWTSIEPAT